MTGNTEYQPGDPAPEEATYRLLDVFGGETKTLARVGQGQPLPVAPRGHTWRLERKRGDAAQIARLLQSHSAHR